MKLFQIDYLKKTGALMKEAFTLKKYKAMHPALATFVGIFMSPFLLIGLLLTAILAVFAFVVNLLFTPLKHVHSLFQTEAKDVKHATQTVIYLISWPIFYFLYFAFSWLFIVIYLLYALLSIFMYIFTLGGFKYHISPNFDSDDIAIKTKRRYFALPVVTICVSSILLVTMIIFGALSIVTTAEADKLYNKDFKEAKAEYNELKDAEEEAAVPVVAAQVEEEEAPEEGAADDEAPAEEQEEQTEDTANKETTADKESSNNSEKGSLKQAEDAMKKAKKAYEEKDALAMTYMIIAGAAAAVSFLTNMLMSLIGYAPRCIDKGEACECRCEVAEANVVDMVEAAEETAVVEDVNV